jgi:MoxR-like ATPase
MQELRSPSQEDAPAARPFVVIATQNPIEYEGTFPLPEAQLDRFMVRLDVGYPKPQEEVEILRRRAERGQEEERLNAVSDAAEILAMRAAVETVVIDQELHGYIIELSARRGLTNVRRS